MSTSLADPRPGSIAVGALSQARRHKRRFDAVITLEEPGCRWPLQLRFHRKPHPEQIIFEFEDVDYDDGCIRVASSEQVAEALGFARRHAAGALLIHCYHGVGRSAAVALAVLADRLGVGREREALDRLLEIRPEATPNLVVVGHADTLLGRGGALLSVVADWEARTPHAARLRAIRHSFVEKNAHFYARR